MKTKFIRNNTFIFILLFLSTNLFCYSHTVKKGETLYAISREYGIPVNDICKANSISKDAGLRIGQELVIPGYVSKEETDTYTVQKGDTLYSIAKKFNIDVETLNIMNQLSGTTIKIGQSLVIPQNASSIDIDTKSSESEVVVLKDPRKYDTNKTVSSNIVWPVKAKEVNYTKGKVSGVALTASVNEAANAIRSGNVMFSGVYRGFGKVVFIQTPSGHIYVYTGLDKISVSKGDLVNYGDRIGTVGIDSISGKPVLNLMVFQNGKPLDPAKAPRG